MAFKKADREPVVGEWVYTPPDGELRRIKSYEQRGDFYLVKFEGEPEAEANWDFIFERQEKWRQAAAGDAEELPPLANDPGVII